MEIKNKQFEILISKPEIDQTIQDSCTQLKDKLSNVVFVVMANGANWFAQKIFENFPNEIINIEYALLKSYSGNQRNKIEVVSIPEKEVLQGKTAIIIEDFVDSGHTMNYMLQWCRKEALVENVFVCPLAIREGENPNDYNIINKPIVIQKGKWIVGCGLDYNHYGRNLSEIYYMKI